MGRNAYLVAGLHVARTGLPELQRIQGLYPFMASENGGHCLTGKLVEVPHGFFTSNALFFTDRPQSPAIFD